MQNTVRMLISLLVLNLVATPSPAQQGVPDSPKGFDKQMQEVFKAYMQGDAQTMNMKLDEFKLPDHWFTDAFESELGRELAQQYATEFKRFKDMLGRRLDALDRQDRGRLNTKLKNISGEPKPPAKPAPVSLLPLPTAKHFEMKLTAVNGVVHVAGRPGAWVSWMDTFVYVEGRFRYWGGGAYPFWDPAKIRLADPCAKPGQQTGGRLVNRVEPVYPEAARQGQVQGIVRMRITVAKDGTVRDVEFIEGHPLLQGAAKEAVLHWRYEPFMNCGSPVEMRDVVHIKFVLP